MVVWTDSCITDCKKDALLWGSVSVVDLGVLYYIDEPDYLYNKMVLW